MVEEAKEYYKNNYDCIAFYDLSLFRSTKIYIDEHASRPFTCRFCRKSSPEVSFRNVAHAISELVGNKSVLIKSECDKCNKILGNYEDQFAKFLGPARTICQTQGKKGVPSYKSCDKNMRMDFSSQGLIIQKTSNNNSVTKKGEVIHLELEKDAYIPLQAFKGLVGMAMSVIPEAEFGLMRDTNDWLMSNESDINSKYDMSFYSSHVMLRSIEGNKPIPLSYVFLRRKKNAEVPYALFKLEFDNFLFQIMIPSPQNDTILIGKAVSIYPIPSLLDIYPFIEWKQTNAILDMSSKNIVRNEKVYCDLQFSATDEIESANDIEQKLQMLGVKTLDIGS